MPGLYRKYVMKNKIVEAQQQEKDFEVITETHHLKGKKGDYRVLVKNANNEMWKITIYSQKSFEDNFTEIAYPHEFEDAVNVQLEFSKKLLTGMVDNFEKMHTRGEENAQLTMCVSMFKNMLKSIEDQQMLGKLKGKYPCEN